MLPWTALFLLSGPFFFSLSDEQSCSKRKTLYFSHLKFSLSIDLIHLLCTSFWHMLVLFSFLFLICLLSHSYTDLRLSNDDLEHLILGYFRFRVPNFWISLHWINFTLALCYTFEFPQSASYLHLWQWTYKFLYCTSIVTSLKLSSKVLPHSASTSYITEKFKHIWWGFDPP